MTATAPPALVAVLERARSRGFLGPGRVADHIAHATAMGACATAPPEHFLDLGSGAGIPGLVLALTWANASGVLLDAGQRRCSFLREATDELALADRLSVACGRAEELARAEDLRGTFDLVVARSFGPPAVVAECAVGFLSVGGELLVSEPPDGDPTRWPPDPLGALGFGPATVVRNVDVNVNVGATATFVRLSKVADLERWPRRSGVPSKRPVWNLKREVSST